jgi:hypothetical protein
MTIKTLLFFLIIICFSCTSQVHEPGQIQIESADDFPCWLKTNDYRTDQTSGITLISETGSEKIFLLADDVGHIHRFIIEDDSIFSFNSIHFSNDAELFLQTLPKRDFEEIVFDKHTGKVFLSIEGNRPDPKKHTGIFELKFFDNDIQSDSIIGFEKINFTPHDLFIKYLDDNIGYEGLAVDENFFYLGLEGFSEKGIFADSTVIFIADKKSAKIIKEINTKELGLFTVCGLFSDRNYSLWGIDRNSKKLFHILFNNDLDVEKFAEIELKSPIPGYPHLEYVASFESLTIDSDQNIYMIDDPWKKYFIPSEEILTRLDSSSTGNFKEYIPVIHKFVLNQ